MKKEKSGNILVGGVDLPSQLIALDLVDEFLFVVHPVIRGGGRRLMEGVSLPAGKTLTLVDTAVLSSGHVALRYAK